MMKSTYKALVIGSGFGGAVAACRLAQAGLHVGVLERGKDYRTTPFPRNFGDPRGGWWWPVQHGLFDVKPIGEMLIVQCAGLGGGSLIYANVQMRPPADTFAHGWPAGYTRSVLDPYYDLVGHMLSIMPCPADKLPLKARQMRAAASRLGREPQCFHPNLAITFTTPDPPSPEKLHLSQASCTGVGECDIGCSVGAKNTLDKTYLTAAEQAGAEIGTECEATRIEPRPGGGYRVHCMVLADGREQMIETDLLFVCAGAVNTTELLLRCRDQYKTLPELSPRLGTRYSGNGDYLAFVRGGKVRQIPWDGPTITTAVVQDTGRGPDRHWFLLEDGGYPKEIAALLRFLDPPDLAATGDRLREALETAMRKHAVARASDALDEADAAFLLMGRDQANGRITLAPFTHFLHVLWDVPSNLPLYNDEARLTRDFARELGGTLVENPLWRYLRQPVSVHNLGGCVMADRIEDGVIDARGEVFRYPGLFVLDGAAIPGAVGANPAHTIAAVAERNIEVVIRRVRNEPAWCAPESPSVRPIHEPLDDVRIPEGGTPPPITPQAGVKFTETMEGFLEPGAATEPFDFAAGYEYGRRHNIPLDFRLTIAIEDIDEFLVDPAHAGVAAGQVFVAGRTGKNGAPVTQGVFNLFVRSGDELHMLYELPFFGQDGQPYLLDGFKRVGRHDLMRAWPATTTLYTAIREGHSRDGNAIGIGIMRLTLSDFARQLTTFRATGARSRREALDALVKFGRMFVGSLSDEFFENGHTRRADRTRRGARPRPSPEAIPIR
jgi:cholesterol oxidase